MKTIKLTRMELQNFKGVAQATYEFTDQTNICGGNATGKSTIYEAYLWCLFDKNQSGNSPKVQPLDENNEVRHKLTTSVKLHLTIDGNRYRYAAIWNCATRWNCDVSIKCHLILCKLIAVVSSCALENKIPC